MNAVMLGILLLTARSQAQVTGDCGKVIQCPQFFMPQPTTTGDKTAVIQAFADARAAENKEEVAERRLQSRWNDIKSKLSKGILNRLLGIDDAAVQAAALSDPTYLNLMMNYQTAQTKNYSAHNEAIIQTAIAYNLTPPISDFTGDPRAAEGNMVAKPWLPHFSRLETFTKAKGWHKRDPDELSKEMRDEGAIAAALTHADGSIGIFDNAFTSPDELAVLIYHETSHWVDIAGRSGGFNKSDPPEVSFLSEARAYANGAGLAGRLGLDSMWQIGRAARFTFQAEESKRRNLTPDDVILMRGWIGKQRVGMFASVPPADDLSEDDKSLLESKMAEAKDIADEEKRKQLEIDHREHDERLKNTYLDLADRSCASPGSVTQAELDSLPKPHNKEAMAEPPGLTGCLSSVYLGLLYGANAEDLERDSTPKVPGNVQAQPPQFVPATPAPPIPFENVLPKLSAFAAEACRAPETVSIGDFQARNDREHFNYDYSYMGRDADIAAGLSSRLDECSKALFRRLIAMHRGQQYQEILSVERQWIRNFVAANSSGPGSSPVYTRPPSGDRGHTCEEYGNIRCPKSQD